MIIRVIYNLMTILKYLNVSLVMLFCSYSTYIETCLNFLIQKNRNQIDLLHLRTHYFYDLYIT